MISFIRGTVFEVRQSSVIIDTGSLGYEVLLNGRDLSRMTTGSSVFLYTWLQVREDAMTLFGFFSKDELELFGMLISVSGIGPRGGLAILGTMTADDLRFAVLSDDVSAIVRSPGIGKKTAQKLILELKDKLKLEDAFEHKLAAGLTDTGEAAGADQPDQVKEAVEALVALGYSPALAGHAVRGVENARSLDVETLLKEALKKI